MAETTKIVVVNGSTYLGLERILRSELKYDQVSVGSIHIDRLFSDDSFDLFDADPPDIVWINTTSRNLMNQDADHFLAFLESIWERIPLSTSIVQNNFEYCRHSISPKKISQINELIEKRSKEKGRNFHLCDINQLANRIGLDNWYNDEYWYSFKIPYEKKYVPTVVGKLSRVISKINNDIKKCIVLDLDNTLWGGIIGDDGLEGIKIGRDDPIGEAHNDFQRYLKSLSKKGVLLAVCSKNDPDIALAGLRHPDNVLTPEDFVSFKASWEPKHLSLVEMSRELNIGLDSFVFLDDNPAERDIVRRNLPQVEVPELGNVVDYIAAVDREDYFSSQDVTEDDKRRVQFYKDNFKRNQLKESMEDYGEYLRSLEMEREIEEFSEIYFPRISQLSKRTNQFNLTTKRFETEDIRRFATDENYITLYGKLKDRFGDNGLVSAMIGQVVEDRLEIILWVMSCRVFKREFELAMFDRLVEKCRERNISEIAGIYGRTEKNKFVENLYQELGFELVGTNGGDSSWRLKVHGERNGHA